VKITCSREDGEQLRAKLGRARTRVQSAVTRKDASLVVLALRGEREALLAKEWHQLASVGISACSSLVSFYVAL